MAAQKVLANANENFNAEIGYLLRQFAEIQVENEKLKNLNVNMRNEISNIVNYCSKLITKDFYNVKLK